MSNSWWRTIPSTSVTDVTTVSANITAGEPTKTPTMRGITETTSQASCSRSGEVDARSRRSVQTNVATTRTTSTAAATTAIATNAGWRCPPETGLWPSE
jgi:hypothetical protein